MTQPERDDTELMRALLRTGFYISPGEYVIREKIALSERPIRFKDGLPMFSFGVVVGLLLMAMLCGCSSTEVLEIGGGSYTLTSQAHVHCPAGSREEAVQQANDYCDRSHKKPRIQSFDDKILIDGCTSSIVFQCD